MRFADSAPALRASGLRVSLQGHCVIDGVELAIAQGRWTSVVGPNGAGKSTLLRALAGVLPYQGRVDLLGRDLAQWKHGDRARALAWLGQGEGSAQDLRVWDVAMLGRLPHQPWLSPPSPADHAAVEQALRATQAWEWRERLLGHLSGGERQRVLLARALAVQARVLLMDEPLANLDPPHQADWLALVRELVAQGTTVVSVLHEVGLALHADELLIVQGGCLAYHGACADGSTHRALEAVFEHRIAVHQVQGQWVALPVAVSAHRAGTGHGVGY